MLVILFGLEENLRHEFGARSARLGNGQYVASFDMSSFWDRL